MGREPTTRTIRAVGTNPRSVRVAASLTARTPASSLGVITPSFPPDPLESLRRAVAPDTVAVEAKVSREAP